MNEQLPNRPLRIDLPDQVRRVREAFREADFRGETVLERLGKRAMTAFTPLEAAVVLHRTAEGSALDLLVRLFVVGVPVAVDRLEKTIPTVSLESWQQLGLLARQEKTVSAAVRIMPYHELLLVCDAARPSGSPVDPEYVMGAGTSTNTLAQLMPRRDWRQSLDLGTGCGVLALVAAGHSERTWATDLNTRAVNYAAFNALFNGYEHVIARVGSLFEPVGDERFDLIVSNPPFVISPENRFIFRDGGEVGDELCHRIVGEVPRHLNEGGYCLLLCNWVHPRGEDWRQRLTGWFRGSECDAWVLRSETSDTAKYAALWLSHTEGDAAEDAGSRFQSWLDYYDRAGVEAISYGIMIVRRRSGGGNWIRFDDAPAQFVGPCGEDVEARFRRQDFLQRFANPGELLREPLHLSPRVRLDQECQPGQQQPWDVLRARLRIDGGIAYAGEVDAFVLGVLSACRGNRPVGEIVTEGARAMSLAPAESLQRAAPVLWALVERGFLLPGSEVSAG
ncbi:MAG: class I SAM-dependent methyltransferase [Pirellulales bacterium]|nr:class I SAM-dependent methyltransferase [Pirellulales bacterium]